MEYDFILIKETLHNGDTKVTYKFPSNLPIKNVTSKTAGSPLKNQPWRPLLSHGYGAATPVFACT